MDIPVNREEQELWDANTRRDSTRETGSGTSTEDIIASQEPHCRVCSKLQVSSPLETAMVATFDTLKFANKLKQAGVPDKQAEAEAEVLAEALAVNLRDFTTKDDLKHLEERINARFETLEERSRGRFTLLQWMLGFNLALSATILVKLFLS